jgi:pimeloyl-ACP methyl ester carboxylesterase
MTIDLQRQLLEQQPLVASSAIFSSEEFPRIDFLNPGLVAAALGAYELSTRFFDAGWNEVQRASKPGRYGAWIEVRFASGLADGRPMTLFKASQPYVPAHHPYGVTVRFPRELGLPENVAKHEHENTNALVNGMIGGQLSAILACTLHESAADPARWHGFNYWHHEESWWSVLKDKLGLGGPYRYLISAPTDYERNPDQRWPLLLFLHGTYECGDDLTKLETQGPEGFRNQGGKLPFVVVSPLCPARSSWNPGKLVRLIEEVETKFCIDPKRIYVTGLSMGGFSTFDLAAIYPDKIAAIASLSAGENPDIADRLLNVPAWIFHGAVDPIVSPRQSIEIAERLKAKGAEVRLTILPGVGHEGWEKIYADPNLYTWFLQHARS